jgi:hypothetical protein
VKLGQYFGSFLKPWSKFRWPFDAAEKLGQVTLGHLTSWPSVYQPEYSSWKIIHFRENIEELHARELGLLVPWREI